MGEVTPRLHADLMAAYMADNKALLWNWHRRYGESKREWAPVDASDLLRHPDGQFVVSREQPIAPPAIMCKLAGHEFPMPMREAPEVGSMVYLVDGSGIVYSTRFDDLPDEKMALADGRLQDSQQGAAQMYVAIRAAIKQAMDEAEARND